MPPCSSSSSQSQRRRQRRRSHANLTPPSYREVWSINDDFISLSSIGTDTLLPARNRAPLKANDAETIASTGNDSPRVSLENSLGSSKFSHGPSWFPANSITNLLDDLGGRNSLCPT
ncbi:unnamed protein product [Nippostrongylus brasiliensis]|uniref:Uncharacterized protein n=1 Tax=Nippostrongylus brasiliensis TaxID=27835 RepID=A0A0N4YCP8_NIPBR|nr:unnamed protein product [Nippostrongylus brasiliensis]